MRGKAGVAATSAVGDRVAVAVKTAVTEGDAVAVAVDVATTSGVADGEAVAACVRIAKGDDVAVKETAATSRVLVAFRLAVASACSVGAASTTDGVGVAGTSEAVGGGKVAVWVAACATTVGDGWRGGEAGRTKLVAALSPANPRKRTPTIIIKLERTLADFIDIHHSDSSGPAFVTC